MDNKRGTRKKTWTIVPSGQFEVRNGKKVYKDDLLIVYLENKPNLDANKAHMLGGMSREVFNEAMFDAVSERVIQVLEEAEDVKVNDQVRLFVLRKADKDRRQVVIERNYTVGEVVASAKSWRTAAKNVPPFWLQVEIKEENKSVWLSCDAHFLPTLFVLLKYSGCDLEGIQPKLSGFHFRKSTICFLIIRTKIKVRLKFYWD